MNASSGSTAGNTVERFSLLAHVDHLLSKPNLFGSNRIVLLAESAGWKKTVSCSHNKMTHFSPTEAGSALNNVYHPHGCDMLLIERNRFF